MDRMSMYVPDFGLEVSFDDFEEAQISFGVPSMTKGDLVYDRWEDLGLMLNLCAPRGWEDKGLYGYLYQTKDGEFWGMSRVAGCESFEDAFDLLAEALENRDGEEAKMYRCEECGALFSEREIETTEVQEAWGDVVCWVCPCCHEIDYEGRAMIVEA